MYLVYFDQLFTVLEGPVADLRKMIEDESRQHLGVVVDRIFTNLRIFTPGFDLSTVTEARQGEDVRRAPTPSASKSMPSATASTCGGRRGG